MIKGLSRFTPLPILTTTIHASRLKGGTEANSCSCTSMWQLFRQVVGAPWDAYNQYLGIDTAILQQSLIYHSLREVSDGDWIEEEFDCALPQPPLYSPLSSSGSPIPFALPVSSGTTARYAELNSLDSKDSLSLG
jgi:hypothetical protein